MTHGDTRENEVEKTLGLLGGIGRLPPPPGFTERVMRGLSERRMTSSRAVSPGLRFAIAGILALIACNLFTIFGTGARTPAQSAAESAAIDSLAVEYRLTANEFQDLE